MNALVENLESLPENVLGISVARRSWSGVHLDVTRFQCSGRVVHQLPNDSKSRLSVVMEEVGDYCEPRLRADQPCPVGYVPRHMLYAPADMEVWGFTANSRYVKDATLTFDARELGDQMSMKFDDALIATPRLRFVDDRIWTLVGMLADAVNDPDPSAQLYGDGLATAIAARLMNPCASDSEPTKGLSPSQLRRVLEYLETSLPDHVTLAELATLAGVSQSHFSRAFKTSTGRSPYCWQLETRIQRAQGLLLGTSASLEQVAEAMGFADAVHFGKTFRRITGATPAAWRRAHQR